MKLETPPKVTKSKGSLHWCRSISKKIPAHFLLQYQSKSYYIIGQEVYYSIGRFITLSGNYYIIGRFVLHYRARITVSEYRAFITLSVGTGGLGSKFQKSGKFHERSRKSIKKIPPHQRGSQWEL